jgi:hypothetical protein
VGGFREIKKIYGHWRRRMIHETEVALLYGLLFPERHPDIPSIKVGEGQFDPAFADEFWNNVLELQEDQ